MCRRLLGNKFLEEEKDKYWVLIGGKTFQFYLGKVRSVFF